MGEVTQPEITCPMHFGWFPFDTQQCDFVMAVSPVEVGLERGLTVDLLLTNYVQNTKLDYHVEILELANETQRRPLTEVTLH